MKKKYTKPQSRSMDALYSAEGTCRNGSVAVDETDTSCVSGPVASGFSCISFGGTPVGLSCLVGDTAATGGCGFGDDPSFGS